MPGESIDLFLMDREFTMNQELLKPNRRRRSEARGKMRTLLTMEAYSDEDVEVSEKDANGVESGIRRGARGMEYSSSSAVCLVLQKVKECTFLDKS